MFKVENITKDWKEAGSFQAHLNLYGFWNEHCFLTKSGDLGSVLRIGGIDYESLDHAGRDYAVKRLEAAFRSLDDKARLYQILFKHNRPAIPHAEYDSPLVRAAVEQRSAFLQSKADRLYSIEMYWVVMIDGSYQKTGLLHALSQLPKQPRSSLLDLRALFSGNKERTLIYEQIERDRLRLQQKINSLSGQLNDLMTVELSGAEGTFRVIRRLINFRPSKINDAPLCGVHHLDWQVCDSELEAHRGYLRLDDDYLRVLTLKELPGETRPLILSGLLDIPANFHVVTEWRPVDNAKVRKEIASRRRHHHNSKTSFVSNLQDRQNSGNQDNLVDDSKEAAVAELGNALTAMGMEGKSFGEFTLSVVIYDEDRLKVEHVVAEFQKLFTQHDGLLYEERYNLLNAFFATVPGNKQFNLRKQWALNSNYADLSFLFTVDSGSQWNPHLEREYLAVLESTHGTPYYFNMHCGDVAHALMLGATGSGKSFVTSFQLQSVQKYDPLTFIFDLGGSYETLTRAFRGTYLNVGLKNPGFTINPFSLEATHENMNFLYLFLRVLIEAGVLSVVTLGCLALLYRAQTAALRLKPLVISVSDIGRGQVMNYDDFARIPIDRVSKYYLARWAQLYYGRNHATLQRNFAESLNFFSNPLQNATLQQVQKAKTLETFLFDPSTPDVDIEIDAVILEDLRQSPYRAQIQFEKVFRFPGDEQQERRERWTANVIYSFRDEVPNAMLLTNPLGLVISYVHEDQAFRS
ncbi:MAG: VirB8/TrbF family protein [Acidobacteriaceae bacterium]